MGGVLRDPRCFPLYEDVVCLIEDFLFTRDLWETRNRLFQQALSEDDYDVVVHLFHTWVFIPSVLYTDTYLERMCFRYAESTRMLQLLISLSIPGAETVLHLVVFYALAGRCELLEFVCQRWELPARVFERALCHVKAANNYRRYFEPPYIDYLLPLHDRLWEYTDCAYVSWCVSLDKLQELRKRCAVILRRYRTFDGVVWYLDDLET